MRGETTWRLQQRTRLSEQWTDFHHVSSRAKRSVCGHRQAERKPPPAAVGFRCAHADRSVHGGAEGSLCPVQAAHRYADTLMITAISDPETYPDLKELGEDLKREIQTLTTIKEP